MKVTQSEPLQIMFGNVEYDDGSESDAPSWGVRYPPDKWLICGLARKRDAEIALRFLLATGIDWCAPLEEARLQVAALFGNKFEMRKRIIECLQW